MELITLVSFYIIPLLHLSSSDKWPLCSAGLLQVTGCVNITWLIGRDKSCTLLILFFFSRGIPAWCPTESSACIQTLWRTLNWLLCLPPADPNHQGQSRAPVAMGTRTVAASSLLFALARNQSGSGGGDGQGRVGGDVASRDGRGDTAS